jgi:hypothetical protein
MHDVNQYTGYIDNKNLAIEYRWAHGGNDRLPTLVDEFLSGQIGVQDGENAGEQRSHRDRERAG